MNRYLPALLILFAAASTAAAAPPLRCALAPAAAGDPVVETIDTRQHQRCARDLRNLAEAAAAARRPRHPAHALHRAAAAALVAATRFVHDAVRRSWPAIPPAAQAAIATAILTGPDGLAAAALAAPPRTAPPPDPGSPPPRFAPLDTSSITALAATGAIRIDDMTFPIGPPAHPDLLAAAAAAEHTALAELQRRGHAFLPPPPPTAAPRAPTAEQLATTLLAAMAARPNRFHIPGTPACGAVDRCPFARLLPSWLRAFRAERRLACGNPAEEPPLPTHLQRRCAAAGHSGQ